MKVFFISSHLTSEPCFGEGEEGQAKSCGLRKSDQPLFLVPWVCGVMAPAAGGLTTLPPVPRVCSRGALPREPGVQVSKCLFGFCGPTSARRGSPCSRLSDVHTRFAQERAPTGRIPEAAAEQLIANKSLMYGKARRCSLRRGRSDSRSPAVSRKCHQASDEAVETGRGRRSHLSSTPPEKFVPNSSLCGCDSIFTL